MSTQAATDIWCSAALATRVWDRSPALAWLLDVPPPALLRDAAQQWTEQGETTDGRRIQG